ncbi:MAG: hypothetical protein K2Q32_09275 [Alphaproteobacteria bacterium]|nr:hypothetical protein [Alphaproteobacteria bacterium]
MTTLDAVKATFNPYNAHALWGDARLSKSKRNINAAFGPAVITYKGEIPLVRYGSYVAGEVRIMGNARIDETATIRRQSFVFGSKAHGAWMERGSLIMDYCKLISSHLGEGAGFAHGGISLFTDWGKWSFANIAPIIKGKWNKRSTVAAGAYIGPGVAVPAGAFVEHNRYYLFNLILPNVGLDPNTFERVIGAAFKRGEAFFSRKDIVRERPIAFTSEQLQGWLGELPDVEVLRKDPELVKTYVSKIPKELVTELFRLDPRYLNLGHFADVDVRELGRNGVDAWLDERGVKPIHTPTLGNWLNVYLLMQRVKQLNYMNEDARVQGQMVWHNAAMQSEILHLDRVRRVMEVAGGATKDLNDLIKAKLYLLGATPPLNTQERAKLDKAFLNAETIIAQANIFLKRGISDDVHIQVAHRETLDTVLQPAGKKAYELTVTKQERDKLIDYLGYAAKMAQTFKPEIAKATPPQLHAAQSIPAWIEVASSKLDVRLATHVRRFNGNNPVISRNAIFVGKNDVGGAGEIGDGVIVKNSSIRSESNRTPFFIAGLVYLYEAVVHTAGKEQFPVYITSAIRALKEGKKRLTAGAVLIMQSHIHGPVIEGLSYIKRAIIGDVSRQNGIVAPGSLNPGLDFRTESDAHALIGGNLGTNILRTEGGKGFAIQYPAFYQAVKTWYGSSIFKGIPLFKDIEHLQQGETVEGVAARHAKAIETVITKTFDAERKAALEQQKAEVAEYGDIIRDAPFLQAGLLNIEDAIRILKAQELDDDAEQLQLYAQGLEKLLGRRTDISAVAAAKLDDGAHSLKAPLLLLEAIQKRGDVVAVPNWTDKTSPYTVTFDEALETAQAGAKPLTSADVINAAVANHPKLNPNDIDHVITSDGVIETGLVELKTCKFQPKQIGVLISQIAQIPAVVAEHKLAANKVLAQRPAHQALGAGQVSGLNA